MGLLALGQLVGLRRVGGKRFLRRGNRRRPPRRSAALRFQRSFCHPTALPSIAALRYRNSSGDTKLASESIASAVLVWRRKYALHLKARRHITLRKAYTFCYRQGSLWSDQKARLSSDFGTAKRFSSRKPPQAEYFPQFNHRLSVFDIS